jgi:multiple sugar transport system permease protein
VSNLGLVDSLWGIIVPNMISVTITFFLRQTFSTFPKELEEAAKMDGCGHLRIFAMVLRLNSSALTAMGVLVLLFAWNDLLWPTMVTSSTDKRVLSVFIALTQSGFGNEYGYLMAAGVLAILPLIVIYLICQKAFMTSIAMSGIKD